MSNIFKKCVVVLTAVLVLGYASGANAVTQAEYDALLARIDSLIAIITSLGGDAGDAGDTGGATITGCTISSFDRALMLAMSGDDVKCLQIVLNTSSDTAVASSGVGSAGEETNYFGSLTKAAVIKFQEKYAADILATYGLTTGTGYVGTTTRAKLNTLLSSGAGDPADPADPADPSEPAADGTVAVSLVSVSDNSLAKGSVGVDVAAFRLTAGTDTTLNTFKITRSGLGLTTDYDNIYLYDGVNRLKPGRTLSSDTNTVEFTSIGLALTDGVSKTITVKVDVYATATIGDKNTLSVVSASDIGLSSGTVTGSFPLNGAEMEISAISIGTATIADGGALTSPSVGQSDAKVAKFRITAGSNNITVDNVTLTQSGSISSNHLTNFVLKVGTVTVATTDAISSADQITLVFDTPYAIEKSQNKIFSLYADIGAAKSTDGIKFYLEESIDIAITDVKYNQGAGITNSYATGNASSISSLQGGDITLSDNGPVSDTVARGTNNIALLNFGVVTTRNVTVRDYEIDIDAASNQANSDVNAGTLSFTIGVSTDVLTVTDGSSFAAGDYIIVATTNKTSYDTSSDMIAKIESIASTHLLTITPVAGSDLIAVDGALVSTVTKVTSVKLMNVDTGSVLYSSDTARYFYNGNEGTAAISASDDFDLDLGTTYNLAIKVNLSAYATPDMTLTGKFNLGTANWIKDYGVNEYIDITDIVPTSLTGAAMTVGSSSLTVARASTPVSVTKVKGAEAVDVLGVSLTAGSSDDVTLTEMIVRFNAATTTTFVVGTGDINPNTVVAAVNLYDGSTKIAGPKSIESVSWAANTDLAYYKATFDGLSYVVPAGSSQKLTVKVDIPSTVTTAAYLAATVAPAVDMTAEDSEGSTLTIAASAYGSINEDSGNSTVQQDTTPAVQIYVATAGTLSAKVEGTSDQAIVIAGASNVVMSKYKFSALYESFELDKLDVINVASGAFNVVPDTTEDENITRIGIKADGVTTWSNLVSGKASFSGLGITVPADGNVYVEVLADLNTIAGGATSGESPRLGINTYTTTNNFRAVGASTISIGSVTFSNESDVNAMTLRKTAPTIAKKAGLTTVLVNGSATLYGFTVAADANEAVSLKGITFKVTGSNADLTSSNFKFYRGNSDITDKVAITDATFTSLEATTDFFIGTAQDTVIVKWDGETEEIISAGTENTYYLKATIAGVADTFTISTYIADDTVDYGTTVAMIPSVGAQVVTGVDGTVLWSTAGTGQIGDYSMKITQAADTINSTYVEIIPQIGITFADLLATSTTAFAGSYKYFTPSAAVPWIYAELKFVDPADSDNFMDVTDQNQHALVGASTWGVQNLATSTGFAYWGTGDEATSSAAVVGNLNAIYAEFANSATISQDDINLYELTRVRIHMYEAGSGVVEIDDITIGTTVYAMEPTNLLWSDNSNTSHSTRTSDWYNGLLVDSLMTDTLTLAE